MNREQGIRGSRACFQAGQRRGRPSVRRGKQGQLFRCGVPRERSPTFDEMARERVNNIYYTSSHNCYRLLVAILIRPFMKWMKIQDFSRDLSVKKL